ncbi:MAG: DNA replication protein DnaD [Eubacterium sp.]|nr:DNA replication protein DnaD [Eubacterium sp.]
MQGWIKSYRSILDHWLWTDKPFAKGQAWIDILHLVNHTKEKKFFDGKLIDVERGETITSIRKLTERWGWSNTKVKNFLNILEQEKMISLEKSDSKKTVLKVLNYAKYQDTSYQENDTETTVERQSNDTETTVKHTNKNVKNIKNDKNVKNSVVISEEITCQTESVRPSIQLIVDAWNSLQKDTAIKPVSRIATSSTRYKLLSARLKEYGIDNVLNAIENIRQSDFLKGNNDRGWIITFDWFVKPNNFPKVLEGNYCNTVGTVCNQTKRKSEYDEFMADLATIREECIRNGE